MKADGNDLTAKQLRVASEIDAAMQPLLHAGKDDLAIFVAMGKHMMDFKWLVDSAELATVDELCRHYVGFFQYGKLLETISNGVKTGAIKAPRR